MRSLTGLAMNSIVQDIMMDDRSYNDLEVLPDELKDTAYNMISSYDFMIASHKIMEPLAELVLNLSTFSQIFVLDRPGPEPRTKEKYVRIKYKYDTECTLFRPNAAGAIYQSLVSTYEMRKEINIANMIKSWGLNNPV